MGKIESVATYLNNNNGYFSNYQLRSWEMQYATLFTEIDINEFEDIGLGDDEIAALSENLFATSKVFR